MEAQRGEVTCQLSWIQYVGASWELWSICHKTCPSNHPLCSAASQDMCWRRPTEGPGRPGSCSCRRVWHPSSPLQPCVSLTSWCLQASSYCPLPFQSFQSCLPPYLKIRFCLHTGQRPWDPPEKIRRGNRTPGGLQRQGRQLPELEAQSGKWHFPCDFMFSWGLINNRQTSL